MSTKKVLTTIFGVLVMAEQSLVKILLFLTFTGGPQKKYFFLGISKQINTFFLFLPVKK